MPWDGNERREHDEACHKRMDKCIDDLKVWIREYVQTQICIATKGTKIWNRYMRPIMMLLLSAAIVGHFYNPTEGMSQEGAVKDKELEVRVQKVEEAHKEMAGNIGDIDKKLGDVDKQLFIQTYILNEMAKEYDIKVPKSDGD